MHVNDIVKRYEFLAPWKEYIHTHRYALNTIEPAYVIITGTDTNKYSAASLILLINEILALDRNIDADDFELDHIILGKQLNYATDHTFHGLWRIHGAASDRNKESVFNKITEILLADDGKLHTYGIEIKCYFY